MKPCPHQVNEFVASAGGYFSGLIRVGDQVLGVITSPKVEGQLRGVWHNDYTDVPGAMSCFDSRANTIAMAAAGSDIAQRALAATINGHSDWLIPSRDVLEVQYRAHKPTSQANYVYRSGDNPSSVPVGYPYAKDLPAQCESPLFQADGEQAFEQGWYWSSTQSSPGNAWGQHFADGSQYPDSKGYEGVVRLVRLIQLDL